MPRATPAAIAPTASRAAKTIPCLSRLIRADDLTGARVCGNDAGADSWTRRGTPIEAAMDSTDSIAAERARAVRLARLMLEGQLSPRDGAAEITSPVDPAGGPTQLSAEQGNLYMEFYGVLSEWEDSEGRWRDEGLPADLVASYEGELLDAAGELIARADTTPSG